MRTIWTLKVTESWGESKKDSKGRFTFMIAASINVPLKKTKTKTKKKTEAPAVAIY